MTNVDIDACIALAREAKEWNNVQDLADAVLALAKRVRELERSEK